MAVRIRTRARKATPGVGYGNPPVYTRFKPGKSGNPKGRPRAKLAIDAILEKSLRKKVSVLRNGSRESISLLGAIVDKLIVDAANGDSAARKLILQLNERRELAEATSEEVRLKQQPATLDPPDQEILDDYRREILSQAVSSQDQLIPLKKDK
jgi:hypothetical protein